MTGTRLPQLRKTGTDYASGSLEAHFRQFENRVCPCFSHHEYVTEVTNKST